MKRAALCGVLVLSACSEEPAVAAKAHNIFLSTGLAHQGGALLGDKQAVTLVGVFDGLKEVNVKDSAGEPITAKIAKQDDELGLSLVLLAAARDPASVGVSTVAENGVTVTSYVIDPDGSGKIITGTTSGFRYHLGKAYLETDLDVEKRYYGSGVYGPEGKLIGLVAFELGKRTYVYPVEYIVNHVGALAGHHELRSVDVGNDDEIFVQHRGKAAQVLDPLPEPLTKDSMSYVSGFSQTALVGELTVLDDKDDPAHKKPVTFEVHVSGDDGGKKTVAKGTIEAANMRWQEDADSAKILTEQQAKAFGPDFVKKEIAPYTMGYLRYRIPYAPFCAKVKSGRMHVLVVTLADGRKTDDLEFRDLKEVCGGAGGEDGTAMEQAWGMVAAAGAAAAEPSPAGKKKKKKKKRKKRR